MYAYKTKVRGGTPTDKDTWFEENYSGQVHDYATDDLRFTGKDFSDMKDVFKKTFLKKKERRLM